MPKKDIANIRLLLKISRIRPSSYAFIILLAIVSSLIAVLPAQIISLITDLTIGNRLNNQAIQVITRFSTNIFMQAIVLLFLFLLVIGLSSIIRNFFCYKTSIISNKIIMSTRRNMIDRLIDIDYEYYEDHKKGEILFNVINNNSSLENIFSTALFTIGSDLFDLFWIIVILMNTNAFLLLILLVFLPVIYYISLLTGKTQRELSQKRLSIENEMTAFVDQTITGIDIIKIFSGKNRELLTYSKLAEDIFGFNKRADQKLSIYFVFEKLIKTTALVCALYFCFKMVETGQLSAGIIPLIIIYSEKLFSPVSNFTKYYQIIQRGLVSLNQICDFLRTPLSKRESFTCAIMDRKLRNSLLINSLWVCRKNRIIIKDFNLEICENGLYLIKGESGCGKSTLLKTILGFIKPMGGSISINGFIHYSYDLISYSGQDPFLTDATIQGNILYPFDSKSCGSEMINKAQSLIMESRLSGIDEQKMMGEFGGKISSGERQRICFLRALLKETPILLLDEITSNVDFDTELLMIDLLKKEKHKRIILFATHSLNQELLNAADRFINL